MNIKTKIKKYTHYSTENVRTHTYQISQNQFILQIIQKSQCHKLQKHLKLYTLQTASKSIKLILANHSLIIQNKTAISCIILVAY